MHPQRRENPAGATREKVRGAAAECGIADETCRLLVEAMPNAVVLADAGGLIRLVNAGAEKLFGYPRGELLGQPVEMLVPARLRDRHSEHRKAYAAHAEARLIGKDRDLFALCKDGSEVPVEIGLNPIQTAEGVLILSVIVDITDRKRAEEALRASEERLRLITNLVPHGIFAKDAAGRYIFANRALADGCGLPVEEILGKTDFDLVSDRAQAEAYMAGDRAVIESGVAKFIAEEPNTDLSGRTRFLQTTKIPFTVPETGESAVMGVWVDITERKLAKQKLEESEQRFQTMANSMSQLAWIARGNGFIEWYNQRWYDYTGTTPEAMEGWGWQSVHDAEKLPAVMERWTESIAAGEAFEMEFPLRGADGKFRRFLTRALPFKDAAGRVMRWFGTNTDVDELKRAEDEIRRLNTELEQRVVERTAQLEVANKELEAFSYSVSHDLRAPLRAMDGFSQALIEECGEQLPAEGKRYLRTIREGARRMGALIADLLAFSRLSRIPLTKRKVDAGKLVQEVLADLAAEQKGRQIDLRTGKLPACLGDPALLRQVWANLLSNAFKYSANRKPAVIEIGCTREPEGNVYFVRDNGAGFDMRYADKLFGVFQRLHRAEDYEGTGVGLAIVRRVIHRHGGRVWAEAEVDRGATFYFTLEEGRER